MPLITENLRDAQTLAAFSNLEPAGVEYFRVNYPDFAPQAWWDYSATDEKEKQWQMNQRFLRESWQDHFAGGLFFLMRLVLSVFDPNQTLDAWFDFQIRRPAFANLSDLPYDSNSYQKAVLYLYQQPWRARLCAECKKRFVAAEPKNKYCSEACSHESRNRQKRESWSEHGHEWRPRKARRRSKPVPKQKAVVKGGKSRIAKAKREHGQ